MKTALAMALDLIPAAKGSPAPSIKQPMQRSLRKTCSPNPISLGQREAYAPEGKNFQQTLQTVRQETEPSHPREDTKPSPSKYDETAPSRPREDQKTPSSAPTKEDAEAPQQAPDQAPESKTNESSKDTPKPSPQEKKQPQTEISGENLLQSPLPLEAIGPLETMSAPCHEGQTPSRPAQGDPLIQNDTLSAVTNGTRSPSGDMRPESPKASPPDSTPNPGSQAPSENLAPAPSENLAHTPSENLTDVRFIVQNQSAKDALKSALKEIMSRQKPEMDHVRPFSDSVKAAPSEAQPDQPFSGPKLESAMLGPESPSLKETLPLVADLASPQPLSLKAAIAHETSHPLQPTSASIESIQVQKSPNLSPIPVKAADAPLPLISTALSQVEKSVTWLLKQQEKGAEIQLNPEKLGRVVIRLSVDGDEVHARLWASEASTVPILQEHKHALEQSLREQGLNLGSFDLQQGHRDGTKFDQSSKPASFSMGESEAAREPMPQRPLPDLGGAHLIECFA